MAMSKKERAEFDRIVDELRLVAALRWTEPVAPDVLRPPLSTNALSVGYLPIGVSSDYPRVSEACSSSINHGLSHTKTTSQNPRDLYSTRLLALKALRHMVELRCAEMLARIDRQIAEAQATNECGAKAWPKEEQPDGTVTPVDPADMTPTQRAAALRTPTPD